jgi:hypothetical protein
MKFYKENSNYDVLLIKNAKILLQNRHYKGELLDSMLVMINVLPRAEHAETIICHFCPNH